MKLYELEFAGTLTDLALDFCYNEKSELKYLVLDCYFGNFRFGQNPNLAEKTDDYDDGFIINRFSECQLEEIPFDSEDLPFSKKDFLIQEVQSDDFDRRAKTLSSLVKYKSKNEPFWYNKL